MAFPPAPIDADKTDSTPTFGVHADHHNQLADAINDTVTHVQGFATGLPVDGTLARVEAALIAAGIMIEGTPS